MFNSKWVKVIALVAGCSNGLTLPNWAFFSNHTITPDFGYTYDPRHLIVTDFLHL